VSFSGREG